VRHGHGLRKFSRTGSHRRAMFRNLATSLIEHEQCETTVEKAKDLRPIVEKLITLGREDTLHARRQAYSYLRDKSIVHKLFAEIGPRYLARPGGYTRIVRSRVRPGDAAELAVIELVGE
jgi:large subunit ribosomal protein L17